MAKKAALCDSVVESQNTTLKFQEEEIRRGLKLQMASDSLLAVRATNTMTDSARIADLEKKVQVQEGLTEVEKRSKKGWKLAAIGLAALQVIEIIALIL